MAPHNPHLLLISFHFPPILASSGVHRIVSFANAFAERGWRVTVLTVSERVYDKVQDYSGLLGERIRVERCFCLNTARDLAVLGKYPGLLAQPDNWQSWIVSGFLKGRALIRREPVDLLLSTYPIASAHVLGALLCRASSLPWIADFRDPMLQPGYPADPLRRRLFRWVEEQVCRRARLATFTTESALEDFVGKHGQRIRPALRCIPNGYVETAFSDLSVVPRRHGPRVIAHVGYVYFHERNPRAFFQALAELKQEGKLSAREVQLHLRGCGNESVYQPWLDELAIGDLVQMTEAVPYRQALAEMMAADGLLLVQGPGCNSQIPAKVYEYIRAGKPILAITDPTGETGRLISQHGLGVVCDFSEVESIKQGWRQFVNHCLSADWRFPLSSSEVSVFSREHRAMEMMQLAKELI